MPHHSVGGVVDQEQQFRRANLYPTLRRTCTLVFSKKEENLSTIMPLFYEETALQMQDLVFLLGVFTES